MKEESKPKQKEDTLQEPKTNLSMDQSFSQSTIPGDTRPQTADIHGLKPPGNEMMHNTSSSFMSMASREDFEITLDKKNKLMWTTMSESFDDCDPSIPKRDKKQPQNKKDPEAKVKHKTLIFDNLKLGKVDDQLWDRVELEAQNKDFEHLEVTRCGLIKMPSQLQRFFIKTIDLSNNNIKVFPNELKIIDTLSNVQMSNNKIETFPEDMHEFVNLKSLNLACNAIRGAPDSAKNMKLWSLSLSFNRMVTFPSSLCHSDVKFLQLSGNGLKGLPDNISNMKELQLLWITMNNLKSLPLALKDCPKLNTIEAQENSFKTFDFDILKNKSLRHIHMHKNPFPEKMKDKFKLRIINDPKLDLVWETPTAGKAPAKK